MLPLPLSALKAAWPVLGNPSNRNRAVPLTFEQFRYAFANAVSDDEAQALYLNFAVPAPGAPLFQAAAANLNPWTEAQVDTLNQERGPLLIVSGEKDNTVPWSIANASFRQQQLNPGLTEIVEMPNRGHSLTIDNGWREVADTALAFVRRFAVADTLRVGLPLQRRGGNRPPRHGLDLLGRAPHDQAPHPLARRDAHALLVVQDRVARRERGRHRRLVERRMAPACAVARRGGVHESGEVRAAIGCDG